MRFVIDMSEDIIKEYCEMEDNNGNNNQYT